MSCFDQAAKQWDQNPGRVALANKVVQAMTTQVSLQPDNHVIDFGCGSGLITLQLAPLVASVTAMDTSAGMLEVLQEKCRAAAITNVATRLITDQPEPADANQADLVITSMVLHHIPQLEPAVQKLADWVKPGGHLVIVDLEPEDGSFHGPEAGKVHHGLDPEQLAGMLANQKMEIQFQAPIHVMERHRLFKVFMQLSRKI